MRTLKEVLRLHSLGLSQRQVARSCGISQSTVHEYLSAAEAAGLKWPLPADWDDTRTERALFPQRGEAAIWRKHPEPDWRRIHEDLQTHRDLTLQLVWHEHRENDPDGYGYSRFCDLYRRWLAKLDLVLRQEHRAGEKMFVDYAGATIPIHDPKTGAVEVAVIFVAVLGTSSYTFAEATLGADLRNWIGSHIRAYEFFGGVAAITVPDNCKTAVKAPSYYEPDLNPTYRDLAEHYATAIIPARPRRPRDKAKVEVGVQVVQRWIVAALRHRKFFSLDEVNQAIGELLVRLNERPFRKREGSRATLFAQLDRPALKPLPAGRYEFSEWQAARVNLDYHVEIDRHFYSVPHALVHQQVDVRVTGDTVEVLHRGVRVASHVRSMEAAKATTVAEHRPKAHQKYLDQTPSRLIEKAQQIGPETGRLVETILETKRHPEMGYRSCLGILRLGKTYPAERMEAASRRALRARAFNYQSMESILKNQLDRVPLPGEASARPTAVEHDNIRGPEYFDSAPEA
ncbi:MAG: IS21 family transposase [Bryobacterales bacterium]|nr:IS21 family transposase [Bryobacterales bacterium]